ncbi:bacteriocin [Chryseobacterium indologenes]|uniref:bacteriocin n=1 Tax=Chryseobacterium indologenes TaxID=253 RepID=UPI000A48763D|nr:bacteriocin [Chryseobacterium indologenes]
MKNLRKLTKKKLQEINGGAGSCPPIASWCWEWCGWSDWQKDFCLNAVIDMPCNC